MTLEVAAWLIVLATLGVLFIVVLRRMSVLVGRTRDLERFQQGSRAVDGRLSSTIEPLVSQLDEIRRRAGDPQALAEQLEPAQAALRLLADDARRLRPPAPLRSLAAAVVEEVERAGRAADMVEHGLDALVTGRSGRELEAQTSLKRGALNLRHAREASARLVAEIERVRPADLVARRGAGSGRSSGGTTGGATGGGSQPTYLVDGWEPHDRGR
jgi:hypothetical protein